MTSTHLIEMGGLLGVGPMPGTSGVPSDGYSQAQVYHYTGQVAPQDDVSAVDVAVAHHWLVAAPCTFRSNQSGLKIQAMGQCNTHQLLNTVYYIKYITVKKVELYLD